MGTKTEALAAKFEQACKDFESKIRGLSDADWQAKTPEEGWTVAATAHHAAGSTGPISMIANSAATGSPMPPITADGLNQMNADHAKQYANVSREDTLALLSETTEPAADLVRGFSDEQLTGKAKLPLNGMELTAEQIIENVLIGHITTHAASISAAAAVA
ncbi:MAG: maleylpyruvate isomerase N-terminal domain-containing protein [Chloroflexota bacterium]|nr:maleylpyruvate isomerase N-terminal domain-containing protein [Chloroflexota bacterium]